MTWVERKEPEGPRRIGEVLGKVTKRLGLASPDVLATVFAGWNDVVGESLAAHVRPLGLRDGVLYVEVDDPAWASQLRFLGPDVLRRVNEQVGAEMAKELAVRTARQQRARRPPNS